MGLGNGRGFLIDGASSMGGASQSWVVLLAWMWSCSLSLQLDSRKP